MVPMIEKHVFYWVACGAHRVALASALFRVWWARRRWRVASAAADQGRLRLVWDAEAVAGAAARAAVRAAARAEVAVETALHCHLPVASQHVMFPETLRASNVDWSSFSPFL